MNSGVAALLAGLSAALMVVGLGRLVAERVRLGPVVRLMRSRSGARRVRLRPREGRFGRLEERYRRAGIPGGLPAAAGGAVLLGGLGGALAWRVTGLPLALPVALAFVPALMAASLRVAATRRAARMAAQLPQMVRALAAGVGAGLSLSRALERAATDLPEPLRGELGAVVEELRLGARLERALEGLLERAESRDLRVVVTAILVQRRTGGDLAQGLAAIAGRLDDRARLDRELRGMTGQARLTAWLVAALPLLAGVMAELAAPGMLRRSLGAGPGLALLVGAVGLYGLGVVAIQRIGRVRL